MMSSKQFCDQSWPGDQNTPGNTEHRGRRSGSSGELLTHNMNNTNILYLKKITEYKGFQRIREENTEWILAQMMEGWRTDPTPAQVFFREYEARKVE